MGEMQGFPATGARRGGEDRSGEFAGNGHGDFGR